MHIDGVAEGIYLKALEAQQKYAEAMQDKLKPADRERLFVSTFHPNRLLKDSEFNAYLRCVCEELGLTDCTGVPVRLTSHALRHFNIASRFRDGRFLPSIIQREAAHNSVAATYGYGYQSKSDERDRQRKIQASLQKTVGCEPMRLVGRKYEELQQKPTTRLLPGQGISASTHPVLCSWSAV